MKKIAVILLSILILSACGNKVSKPLKNEPKDKPAEPVVTNLTITFAGDTILGTDPSWPYERNFYGWFNNEAKGDYTYFMNNIKHVFANSDYNIVNFEAPFTEATEVRHNGYTFKGPADYVKILTSGHIHCASLANNHFYDFKEPGATDSKKTLSEAGLDYFGWDDILVKDIKGIKIAFVGFNFVGEPQSPKEDIIKNIELAKKANPDYIIVFVHHGEEVEYIANKEQQETSHKIIDAGADILVGSHPHVPQGIEKYDNKYIVYSLGNFIFGGNANSKYYWAKKAILAQINLTFEDNKLKEEKLKIIPISITSNDSRNDYRPHVLEGELKTQTFDLINENSINYQYTDY